MGLFGKNCSKNVLFLIFSYLVFWCMFSVYELARGLEIIQKVVPAPNRHLFARICQILNKVNFWDFLVFVEQLAVAVVAVGGYDRVDALSEPRFAQIRRNLLSLGRNTLISI